MQKIDPAQEHVKILNLTKTLFSEIEVLSPKKIVESLIALISSGAEPIEARRFMVTIDRYCRMDISRCEAMTELMQCGIPRDRANEHLNSLPVGNRLLWRITSWVR